jgi:hypothetical protein
MLAIIPTSLRDIPARWRTQVAERRRLTVVDPAADALERAAKELESAIDEAAALGRMVTVEEYATPRGIGPGTVRKWCIRGEMPGATKNDAGKWLIPVTAVRPPKRVRR